MANISSEIAEIQAASRGSEVRQPIVDALNKVNADALPAVSSSDAGKFLMVDNNGDWNVGSGGLMPIPTSTKQITENGIHDVTNYASASVDVEPDLGTKSITQNGTYQASSDSLDGYSEVIVNVPSSSAVLTTKNITQNGTYNASSDNADGYSSVVVNVSGGGGGGTLLLDVSVISASDIVTEFESASIVFQQEGTATGLVNISSAENYLFCKNTDDGDIMYADLGVNVGDATIYAVMRSMVSGGDYCGIGFDYTTGSGAFPLIYTRYSTWYTSVWGSDESTGVNSMNAFHVLALRINSTTKKAWFFIDGVKYRGDGVAYNSSGQYGSWGGGKRTYNIDISSRFAVCYGALVRGVETESEILANMALIATKYADVLELSF